MNLIFQTLLVLFLTQSVHGDDDQFSTCRQPFDCGKIKQLSYPFREKSKPEYCGHPEFVLDCPSGNDDDPVLLTVKDSQKFLVLDHHPKARILKLSRSDLSETVCPKNFTNTTFDSTPFKYTPKDQLVTLLYDCDEVKFPVPWSFNCPINGDPRSAYLVYTSDPIREHPWPSTCKTRIDVPVLKENLQSPRGSDVGEVLRAGFEVQWTTMDEDKCRDCVDSRGRCGFDYNVNEFTCFCSGHHRGANNQSSCVDIHDQPSSEVPQIVPVASPEGLKSSSPSSNIPPSRGEDDEHFTECSRRTYECGDIKNVSFPFWGGDRPEFCGHPGFKLSCQDKESSIEMNDNLRFRVLNISQSDGTNTMKLEWADLESGPCSPSFVSFPTALSYGVVFTYPETVENLTLYYGCPYSGFGRIPHNFSCGGETVFYANDSLLERIPPDAGASCGRTVRVPINGSALDEDHHESSPEDRLKEVTEALKLGFEVTFPLLPLCRDCDRSGGRCGYNITTPGFSCFCRDGQTGYLCPSHPVEKNVKLKIGIGLGAGFGGILLMCFVFYIYLRRRRNKNPPSYYLSRSISSDFSSGKDVEKATTYHGVHLFSYEELVAATNNFDASKELGDGGFGTVYYGELKDGRAVAVKRLYENNYRRVEQFMNEVEILAHLRHVNLVSLYGCTSRHSHELLLVYEYVPNGTVADHLHGERGKPGRLPWAIRLNIAIETANALAFLHASEIIHRDVKTNNILLDKNFTVKVADFGLSRLFPLHVTHISTAPQGTPGYVDPEYHQCYQLTSKSDVFSFGVVLMELVSSMPAVDITRHRHDINLATMAINRIQNHALCEMVDPNLGFDSDPTTRKMITAVAELAFQCLQHEKDMRPCMAAVLEELKAIQSRDYGPEKAEKFDTSADDASLLKNAPLTLSPNSVTINWLSRNTTPNAST